MVCLGAVSVESTSCGVVGQLAAELCVCIFLVLRLDLFHGGDVNACEPVGVGFVVVFDKLAADRLWVVHVVDTPSGCHEARERFAAGRERYYWCLLLRLCLLCCCHAAAAAAVVQRCHFEIFYVVVTVVVAFRSFFCHGIRVSTVVGVFFSTST